MLRCAVTLTHPGAKASLERTFRAWEIRMQHRRCRDRAVKPILLGLLWLVAQALSTSVACAEVVRFGKPIGSAFTFALIDVGVRAGIFKKHGSNSRSAPSPAARAWSRRRPPAA